MGSPLAPPLLPMLARLARELPDGDLRFEPKWDGFRCLAFRDGDAVDLRSRNDRPLARYFPEVVDAVRALPVDAAVLDGELVLRIGGVPDFAALLGRLHPAASRVARLVEEAPATFVVFDLLARQDDDLRNAPFARRRDALEDLLRSQDASNVGTDPRRTGPQSARADRRVLQLSPSTADRAVGEGWLRAPPPGVDGVVAKAADLRYEGGRRAMVKVKLERTADCVVAGFRVAGNPPAVASLLLGLHDDAGALRHVGVASSFARARASELFEELAPLAVPLDDHPWCGGFGEDSGAVARLPGAASRWTPDLPLDWLPLRPNRVAEVVYDHVDRGRFRHPARFRRWRPDRDAATCSVDQLRGAGAG